jgi:hypothetical protein
MEYHLNFSQLSAEILQQEKIALHEIIDVFNGTSDNTVWDSLSQYDMFGAHYYLIGFAPSKRFIQLIVSYNMNEIFFLDAKTANLSEIRSDFFGK